MEYSNSKVNKFKCVCRSSHVRLCTCYCCDGFLLTIDYVTCHQWHCFLLMHLPRKWDVRLLPDIQSTSIPFYVVATMGILANNFPWFLERYWTCFLISWSSAKVYGIQLHAPFVLVLLRSYRSPLSFSAHMPNHAACTWSREYRKRIEAIGSKFADAYKRCFL